jgi:competence protein ComEA
MSTGPLSARRWAAICLPIVAVLFLFFVGRRATNAATVAPPPSIAVAEASAVDAAVDAPLSEVTPDVSPRPAIEQLADGGVIVDLNVATESELRKLPGVGPTRARKIVELRTHLGRFKSVDDLARIKGFGRATIRRLRPMTRAS